MRSRMGASSSTTSRSSLLPSAIKGALLTAHLMAIYAAESGVNAEHNRHEWEIMGQHWITLTAVLPAALRVAGQNLP